MSWSSKTGQFGRAEISQIEAWSSDNLIRVIAGTDPLVVLRMLAEVMLNGDDAKLAELMAKPEVAARWADYWSDPDVDIRDEGYATRLRELFS